MMRRSDLVGQTLDGRYRIDVQIGGGGLGAGYRAWHVGLNRQVFVRVLHPSLGGDREAVQRFVTEAQLASQLRNPHICEVHDVGSVGGSRYMVMQYLDGERLDQLLQRNKRLSVEQAIKIIEQLCDGLGAAHRAGVVHCDVKPENIFLCPADNATGMVVKLLGFGIAKLARSINLSALRLDDPIQDEREGAIYGTVVYMSPEACLGRERVDSRTDIWALGVILFEMLSGVRPFEGEQAVELFDRILNHEPRSLRGLVPEVPEDVVRVVCRALQKDPNARFENCGSFMAPLSAYLPRVDAYVPPDPGLVEDLEALTREREQLGAVDRTSAQQRSPVDEASHGGIKNLVTLLTKSRPPKQGDIVAGACLVNIIGKGNFGTVWLASDPAGTGPLAVKVFDRDRLGLGLSMYHFRRGVRVMKHLNESPGFPQSVIRLHGFETSGLALTMEFLPGGDLSNLATRGWDLGKKLAVFRALGEAVRFAHENGVLHRDIKPENILMSAADGPVLTDFDISELLFTQTLSAQAHGTQLYAAPEQLAGKGDRSAAGDVYSLGRVLEFLLTEKDPPFRIEPIPKLGDIESTYGLGLSRILRKCTCRDPVMRYLTVSALLTDLARYHQAPGDVGIDALSAPIAPTGRPELSPQTLWSRAEALAQSGEIEEALLLSERAVARLDALDDIDGVLVTWTKTRKRWKIATADARFRLAQGFGRRRDWAAAIAACDGASALVKDLDDARYGAWQDRRRDWSARSGDWSALTQQMRRLVTARGVPLVFVFLILAVILGLSGVAWRLVEQRATRDSSVVTTFSAGGKSQQVSVRASPAQGNSSSSAVQAAREPSAAKVPTGAAGRSGAERQLHLPIGDNDIAPLLNNGGD